MREAVERHYPEEEGEVPKAERQSNTKKLQLTDYLTNNQKDEVSKEEGALITLLAETRRRNWTQDHTISYLKNETGLVMDMDIKQNAQCGILLMFGKQEFFLN